MMGSGRGPGGRALCLRPLEILESRKRVKMTTPMSVAVRENAMTDVTVQDMTALETFIEWDMSPEFPVAHDRAAA